MAIQGDLHSIPLADVIQLVASTQRSGTLYVAMTEEARIFQFRRGDIVSASSLEHRFRLGHALCLRGVLDPRKLEEALAEQRKSQGRSALGEILLRRGAVTEEGLRATLEDQVQDALDDVLHSSDGGFLFAEAEEQAQPGGGISFQAGPLLFEGLRRLDEFQRFSKVFEDRSAILEFAEAEGADSLPPGSDDALTVFELVDGRRSVGQVIRKVPWSEHRAIRALAVLYDARMVRVRGVTESSRFAPSLWQESGSLVPVAPRAAGRAIALATIERGDLVDMHAAAIGDPGLAVAVLRAATSIGRQEGAQFGTLRDAVLALGEDAVRRVLVAAGLRGCYCTSNRAHSPLVWRHSLVTAVAAARLAAALGMPPERAAEAYLCGLLHDVGALILRGTAGGDYERVEALVAEGTPRADAERKLLGIGHDKVGAHALEKWGASPGVIEVALAHHMGAKTEPWQLAVVQCADVLASHVGYDAEGLERAAVLEKIAGRTLGLTPELLERTKAEVIEEASVREPLW